MTAYLMPIGVLLFVSICFLLGKWQGSKKQQKVEQTIIGPEHNNTEVTVPMASLVGVTLDDIPTTGYLWELIDHDNFVLQQLDAPERVGPKPINGQIPIGGSGKVTFKFWAMKPGSSAIRLRQRRPWMEAGTDPYETSFICKVNVISNMYGSTPVSF
jgi:predicted secreted protein